MSFDRDKLAVKLRELSAQGVYLGTSSWKYPGWFGSIYEQDRYVWRGRFSEKRFEQNCLAEFAQTFPAVSVDGTYYKFYERAALEELAAQVPEHFQFAFKVCHEITVKHFPQLPRYGVRAGARNPHFLDARLFTDAFLAPFENMRGKVGVLMFEFSRFGPGEFARGAEFVEALDKFFAQLPRGWPYAVELRNRQWLRPEYFAVLACHGVTHLYNAWADMPPVAEQMAMPGSETNPDLRVVRLLLREGRTFEEAVKTFSPYTVIKDPNPAARTALVKLIRRALLRKGGTKSLIYVNNRFEGHSPGTINAIISQLQAEGLI